MATIRGPIDTYRLNVHARPSGTGYTRIIYLSGEFGLAFVCFIPEGSPMPAGRKRPGVDVFDVYFPLSAWDAIVDLLRNEEPAWFWYTEESDTPWISTLNEPVGEAEPS